ncbi:hypothetical protein, partial [Gemmiger formicilis]|uniref:hypothetical protein n=1 Tax=Gemmiger formicilis TaxID=745368 RepID=UPI003520BE23
SQVQVLSPQPTKNGKTSSFTVLFLCLGKKWSLFGHFDPKMTPKRQNDCARTTEIFNRPGAFCG